MPVKSLPTGGINHCGSVRDNAGGEYCPWGILPVKSLPTGGIDHCGSVRSNAGAE